MSIELRPLGVACNLACHYCYQNPQRDAGNQRMSYNLEKMKQEVERSGDGPFTLFGGEPLLIRFEDLEDLLAWGFTAYGRSTIQTNGVLIHDRHIELFRRFKVSVGISIDGPGALNDARWHGTLEKTRQATALVEHAIERLCREYEAPSLIITLHRGNATAEKLPIMAEWMRRLHALGIKSVRLHLLEVDHHAVRERLALSSQENIQALLAFADIQKDVPGMHLDLFEEIEALLNGKDGMVGCTWRACDPYTTEAVQGIEGNGTSSNCGRTNKEGISFIKASTAGYERYLALYRTPQSQNGCAGCRFFLMCRGQCPGTSIDRDWRNRTEHCQEWKHLFRLIEQRIILAGGVPLTIQPLRFEIERRQIEAWEAGRNLSISKAIHEWKEEQAHAVELPETSRRRLIGGCKRVRPRISWVSERAREIWQPRLERIQTFIEEMTIRAAPVSGGRCAVRLVPESVFPFLMELAAKAGLAATILPREALPGGICTRPGSEVAGVFLAGARNTIAAAQKAWSRQDLPTYQAQLDLPSCCVARNSDPAGGDAFSSQERSENCPAGVVHPLFWPLGISVLPIIPCRLDCLCADRVAQKWMENATAQGYAAEVGWLRECFSWSVLWSELHGIAEVKTPLFKVCFETGSTAPKLIRHRGITTPEGSAVGLSFPYTAPARQVKPVKISG
jgi:uncharacterized protein